jgi:hypothetical protein
VDRLPAQSTTASKRAIRAAISSAARALSHQGKVGAHQRVTRNRAGPVQSC